MAFFELIWVLIAALVINSMALILFQGASIKRHGSQFSLHSTISMTSSLSGRARHSRSLLTDLAYPVVSLPSMAPDPRSLNRQIIDLFSPLSGKIDVAALQDLIATHESRLDHIHILTLLHRCAKYRLSVSEVITWTKITAIIARPQCQFDEFSVGTSLYAMQHYSDHDESVKPYLDILGVKFGAISLIHLNGQALGNAIYGMNRWTGNTPESQRILSSLSMLIERSIANRHFGGLPPLSMKAQEVGTALWGLQSMSSSSPAVRRLVAALTDCIKFGPFDPTDGSGRYKLTSQNIGMALYGLQGLSSEDEEVRRLLTALNPRIAMSLRYGDIALDPQAIGNSLLGLRTMSSSSPEVRELLSLIALGIDASRHHEVSYSLSEQELSCAFSGLQNMRATAPAVEQVLRSLEAKVRAYSNGLRDRGLQGMTPKGLAIAIHGLKSMTTEDSQAVSATLNLLSGLVVPLRQSGAAEWFNSQSLAMFMTGLRGASAADEGAKAIIAASLPWIYQDAMKGAQDVALSGAEVGMVLAGLKRIDCKSTDSRLFINAIAKRISLLDESSVFKGSDFSAALGGLGNIGGDSTEGCDLLAALHERIALSLGGLSSISMTRGEACVALYGLRKFLGIEGALSPASHKVILEKLLTHLVDQIGKNPSLQSTDFSGRSFGMAVYSLAIALRNKEEGSVPAVAVIAAVESLLARLKEEELTCSLDPAAIGMSLYALRYLKEAAESNQPNSLSPLLDALGSTIHDSIDNHATALSGRELAVCITNLRKTSLSSSITDGGLRSVLAALARNLNRASGTTVSEFDRISEGDAVVIMQSLKGMDLSVKEAQAFLTNFAKRLREQTRNEIIGAKACFIPMAPLLLGFFMMQTQLSDYWSVLESLT